MRVAIVGAGVSGLVNARTLLPLGVEVVVYEARADVGGVWSASRGYPGLRIQNDKRAYALSDFPMPASYPRHPDRAQLQSWLAAYCRHHGLDDVIRLATRVVSAGFDEAARVWRIVAEGPGGRIEDVADHLIVANGTLSTPSRPVLPGAEAFEAAGGRLAHSEELGDAPDLAGRRVVLLGFGKSATDIAVAAAGSAASVTVVARAVPWKLPARIGPLPFQALVSSRVGEHLLWAPYRTVRGRVARRLDTGLRLAFQAAVTGRVRAQLGLERLGAEPSGTIKEVSHLVTAGFDRAVDDGRVRLRLGRRIVRLAADDQGPAVHLDDGTVLPADVLVLATGYRVDVAFLDEGLRARLLDEQGRVPLLRHTVPPRVPRLLFAGWTSSFRSTIGSELQAVWIAAVLHGLVEPERRARLGLLADPAAPTGLSIVDQDLWLREAGLPVPWRTVLGELVRPLDPAAYAGIQDRLQQRLRATGRLGAPASDLARDLRPAGEPEAAEVPRAVSGS